MIDMINRQNSIKENPPKEIYLQIDNEDERSPAAGEITWCERQQYETDIKYYLALQKDRSFIEDMLLRFVYDLTLADHMNDAAKDIGVIMCALGHDKIPGLSFEEYGHNIREILREKYDIDSGLYKSACEDIERFIVSEGE